jgi:hypothetical protein
MFNFSYLIQTSSCAINSAKLDGIFQSLATQLYGALAHLIL